MARMSANEVVHIVGVCGSLRRISLNRAVIAAAARLVPDGIEVSAYDGLVELPPF
jgi:chromate reductase, NAD(P)H dehydrogenase (quinone)